MKTTKYQVTVRARTVDFLLIVVNDKEHDLVVFERIGDENGWKREIVVPFSDKYVMISGDSTGVRISGLKEGIKIFSVGCNEVGDLVYYASDLFEEPLQTSKEEPLTLEDTLEQDPALLNAIADVFAEVLNKTSFMKKMDAIRAIIKSVNDGLLINMNIVNSLDMTMKIGIEVEKIVTNYKITHPTSTDDDIVKHVIEYCRLNSIPKYVQQSLEQGMTSIEICSKYALTRQEAEWYLWLFEAYDLLSKSNSKENETTKPNNSAKLQILNVIISRIHDKDDVGDIVRELNVSRSIVTSVLFAYNELKPISRSTVETELYIDYIAKHGIDVDIISAIEKYDTSEQVADFAGITLDEAEWFMWFVNSNKHLATTNDKQKETIKPIISDKLPILNAMIARMHGNHSLDEITNELNVSRSIVTTVMCAYNSPKLVTKSTDSIFVLIDYIVKNRIVDSLKTSVEQNYTVEQVARLESISIYEADWLVWFVKTDIANKKL